MRLTAAVLFAAVLAAGPVLGQMQAPIGPSGGSGSTYTLPAATSSTLGGVKPDGTTITNSTGAISVTYGTAANTAAQGNDSRITGAVQSGGALGAPSSGNGANLTGVPISTGVSGLGTGVATGLGNNVTGSGSPVLATSPTLVTPVLGVATATSLDGAAIGAITPSTGAFTTLSASSTVSGAGFSTYLASPPAIGGTAPAAGTFTALAGSSLALSGNAVFSVAGAVVGGSAGTSVNLTVQTANQTGAFNGALVTVKGGNNSQASGTNNGGAIAITAGNASGAGSTGNGGSITITPGTSVGGTAGSLTLANLPTATGSYVCSTAGVISVEATACPASDIAQKNPLGTLDIDAASARFDLLAPSIYTYKDKATYGSAERVGLYAQDVEKMDPRCVTYKRADDPDSGVATYDDRCVLAHAIGEIEKLRRQVGQLSARVQLLPGVP